MLEKIQTYILTRVNLLYTLCYEIPCTMSHNEAIAIINYLHSTLICFTLRFRANLEFCLLKLLYFTRNYYRISELGLNFPHFEFLRLYLIEIFAFCAKSFNFDQTYLNTGSKNQNVEELSLDLIFYDNFC